jgi:hypothetical protein
MILAERGEAGTNDQASPAPPTTTHSPKVKVQGMCP